eukprot:TRINITY_DN12001_c0_g1_i1.p1 TRINITY_DN12001_c0_g1~~TRINITY_DN12001_c0_g1_i1.p1  ORF type:complete len:311 (+),score=75.06 TRINITY_DN12001_c0_g1_i1:27-935(+)
MQAAETLRRINEKEVELGIPFSASWHQKYADTAWIFVGSLPFELNEGDIVVIFSQYGEIERMSLKRDEKTGKSQGYCWIKYYDQRSTVLAVDNLSGINVLNRILRVDHAYFRPPVKKDDAAESFEEAARPLNPNLIELPGPQRPMRGPEEPTTDQFPPHDLPSAPRVKQEPSFSSSSVKKEPTETRDPEPTRDTREVRVKREGEDRETDRPDHKRNERKRSRSRERRSSHSPERKRHRSRSPKRKRSRSRSRSRDRHEKRSEDKHRSSDRDRRESHSRSSRESSSSSSRHHRSDTDERSRRH